VSGLVAEDEKDALLIRIIVRDDRLFMKTGELGKKERERTAIRFSLCAESRKALII
jgi:hypothetical protein